MSVLSTPSVLEDFSLVELTHEGLGTQPKADEQRVVEVGNKCDPDEDGGVSVGFPSGSRMGAVRSYAVRGMDGRTKIMQSSR